MAVTTKGGEAAGVAILVPPQPVMADGEGLRLTARPTGLDNPPFCGRESAALAGSTEGANSHNRSGKLNRRIDLPAGEKPRALRRLAAHRRGRPEWAETLR